jgi:hypothetical protein
MIDSQKVQCPYCGETFETVIDVACGVAEYVEDCQVCCRPIALRVSAGPGAQLLSLELRREDD